MAAFPGGWCAALQPPPLGLARPGNFLLAGGSMEHWGQQGLQKDTARENVKERNVALIALDSVARRPWTCNPAERRQCAAACLPLRRCL